MTLIKRQRSCADFTFLGNIGSGIWEDTRC